VADDKAVITHVTADPIDVAAAVSAVSDSQVGGIGVFVGTVRATAAEHPGAEVVRLEYEAHPVLAPQKLDEIATQARKRWALARVLAIHRTGACNVGEPTVVVACAGAHRAEALDACRWCIDTIKATVPIWKKEIYADGHAWVGAAHVETSQ
jgi:molybdopterin synthase catalytic subunit